MEESFEKFRTSILHHRAPKPFKIRHSHGVYDIYKAIRKAGWYNIGRPLKEHEFYTIIGRINKLLAQEIGQGHVVTFPAKMGQLEIRKIPAGAFMKDGKLHIHYPVDWDSTLKLWFKDEEARKNKTLVRIETPYLYKIKYYKRKANYKNKFYYDFEVNKKIKKALKENIKAGKIDTLYEGKR